MAPIDIVRAEAEVARNEETAIIAAAQIDLAEDSLRRLIFDPASAEYWTTNIDLTDAAPAPTDTRDVDIEAAVAKAMQQRTDLVQQRKSLEATDINLRFFKNQLLPVVDAYANYGLFYRGGLQTGTDRQRRQRPQLGRRRRTHVRRGTRHAGPSASSSRIRLGHSTQQVNLARARLQQTQTQLSSEKSGAAGGRRSAQRGPQRQHQPPPRRGVAGHAHPLRASARGGAEEVRGRSLDQLRSGPGPARPRQRAQQRTAGDHRLRAGARQLRRPSSPPAPATANASTVGGGSTGGTGNTGNTGGTNNNCSRNR